MPLEERIQKVYICDTEGCRNQAESGKQFCYRCGYERKLDKTTRTLCEKVRDESYPGCKIERPRDRWDDGQDWRICDDGIEILFDLKTGEFAGIRYPGTLIHEPWGDPYPDEMDPAGLREIYRHLIKLESHGLLQGQCQVCCGTFGPLELKTVTIPGRRWDSNEIEQEWCLKCIEEDDE